MVPFDRWRRSSYWLSIVTNYGSITASFPSKSETLVENRDFFHTRAFDAAVSGSPSEYCHTVWYGKLQWCGYQTVKKFDDIFSRFDRIPACDGQTDGRTDVLRQHCPCYAACASRGNNKKLCCRKEAARCFVSV